MMTELEFMSEDRPAPFWPVAHFVVCYSREIVATLFWNHEPQRGVMLDPNGVVCEDVVPMEVVGWVLHVLHETQPDIDDPRKDPVACVNALGADLSVTDAFTYAWTEVQKRHVVRGLSHEESRGDLMWRFEPADDARSA